MPLPQELKTAIINYKNSVSWYRRWPLYRVAIPLALPLIVIILAIGAGIAIGAAIAEVCAAGNMPWLFQWLCF